MPNPAGHVLAAASLANYMAASLSKDVSPQIKTPYDAVALATHAAMIAVGFRLIGLGEDHKVDIPPSDATQTRPLPSEWNAQAPNYAFRYAHSQSSMEYLLKINRMGSKAVVMGMGLGDDKTTTFDMKVDDYISLSTLPATPVTTDAEPSDEVRRAVIDVFISNGRLSDLGGLMRLRIIQKLLPGLQKEGYEETSQTSTSTTSNQRAPPNRGEPERPTRDPLREDYNPPARPYPHQDPLALPPRRPGAPTGECLPPGFEDPYDLNRPPRGMGGAGGPPGFGSIGHRDLYPQGMGPNDPFRNIGPGGYGGGGGGGMHPTFDDPMFGGQGGGGGGFDPQAPPGSRYDPVGPGGPPRGSGGGRFPGGGGLGGRPPNPFGGFGGGDFI